MRLICSPCRSGAAGLETAGMNIRSLMPTVAIAGFVGSLGALSAILPNDVSTRSASPPGAARVASSSDNLAPTATDIEIGALRKHFALLETELTALRRSIQSMRDDDVALKGQMSALRADLSANEVAVSELIDTLTTAPSTSVAATSERAQSSRSHVEMNLDDFEEVHAQQRERIQILASAFEAEPLDADWSAEAVDAIERSLDAEALAGTTAVGVECRSTICQLEVEHDNSIDVARFELWFPILTAEVAPRITLEHEEFDGRVNTIAYLARSGHRMPGIARLAQ